MGGSLQRQPAKRWLSGTEAALRERTVNAFISPAKLRAALMGVKPVVGTGCNLNLSGPPGPQGFRETKRTRLPVQHSAQSGQVLSKCELLTPFLWDFPTVPLPQRLTPNRLKQAEELFSITSAEFINAKVITIKMRLTFLKHLLCERPTRKQWYFSRILDVSQL